ncbi:MAG: type VI secretion system-associated protein TagF [Steroidobacter sp.]
MSGATIGWFGKLPSHGDFLQRRASEHFVRVWDSWLQSCVAHSRNQLGADWLQTYLTSPVWRFFLSDGVAGAASYAGVLLPSVDRVGRYFPLTVFAELPAALPPMAVAIHGREWLKEVEALALDALESEDFNIEDFDAALRSSAETLARIEQYYGVDLGEAFPESGRRWRLPMSSTDRMAAALIDPLMHLLGRRLQPLTVWWTDGSERVGASCLLSQSLPDAAQFIAMLDGEWASAGWNGEFGDLRIAAAKEFHYRVSSAAVTDTGSVRAMNQDRVLDRPDAGVWVVADGMGGHSRGEYASQLIVDVLNSTEPAATLSAALESAREGLDRANDDLLRAALRVDGGDRSGSTVVVLCVRQFEWGVLWAGDSRAYLLRNGVLAALTRDHAASQEEAFDPTSPQASTGEITRAVGGHDDLVLDRATGHLYPGDRFLLCSDGLHGAVKHHDLAEILSKVQDASAAVAELLAQAISGGSRDNISALVVDVLPQE